MKKRRARLRPKARVQRRSQVGRLAVSVLFSIGVILLIRAQPWKAFIPNRIAFPLPAVAAVDDLQVSGAPQGVAEDVFSFLDWAPGEKWGLTGAGRRRAKLLEAFPFLASVDIERSWLRKSVQVRLALRTPVARVRQDGISGDLLGTQGRRFTLPEQAEVNVAGLPVLGLNGSSSEEELKSISRLLRAAAAPGRLPSGIAVFDRSKTDEGWVAGLEDGTRIVWGRLDWTEEKFERLTEILSDARPRFGNNLAVDLRHFEDGKILVRPR